MNTQERDRPHFSPMVEVIGGKNYGTSSSRLISWDGAPDHNLKGLFTTKNGRYFIQEARENRYGYRKWKIKPESKNKALEFYWQCKSGPGGIGLYHRGYIREHVLLGMEEAFPDVEIEEA